MQDQIPRRVAEVIDDLFGVPVDALDDDVELADGLQLDSLSVVELTVALEDVFDIRFGEGEYTDITTFGDLVATLRLAISARDADAGRLDQDEARSA